MARRSNRSQGKKTKKGSALWQWLGVALAAFLLYQGLNYFLARQESAPARKKPSAVSRREDREVKPSPSAEPEASGGPVKKWSFAAAGRFLPEGAYEDNYQATPVGDNYGALLSFAKKIEGKDPGPKGLTHTRPGLRYLVWDGKSYRTADLPFDDLEASLGDISARQFVGLPQVNEQPFLNNGAALFSTKIFLSEDDRHVTAYFVLDGEGIRWAPLHHASGKKMAAAFGEGTTQKTTRSVKQQKYDGKYYLIVENGVLDEYKSYAGYQWNVQAYFWDGKNFTYDDAYSKKLTQAKKLADHK
jgi:hypothetical protein